MLTSVKSVLFMITKMNNHSVYTKSLWNGLNGNECVHNKDYNMAIKYYNKAIELYPLEYRYFVNRSYCYDQLKMFDLALEDAKMAVMLNPDWGKCHFRKGRALKGLKRLEEAETCFFKVLQLEGDDCEEAKKELLSVRKSAIVNFETDSKTAQDVANKCVDINEAIMTIKQMDNLSGDDKLADKRKSRTKRSNRSQNSSIKLKNMPHVRHENFSRANINIKSEKTHTETDDMKSSVSSDPEGHQSLKDESNEGTNILKKLSDFLLINKNNLDEQNQNSCDSVDAEGLIKMEEKTERRVSIDDSKSAKSLTNESKHNNETKSRFPASKNIRNGKNWKMDQVVKIWEDSSERSVTVRPHYSLDSSRNLESTNRWRFKGLLVSNIMTNEQSKKMLRQILSKFGRITFFDIIPETETAVIDFDNPESARLAMSKLQGVHLSNICVDKEKLKIKFRPLNNKNATSISPANERQLNNECYFWRTTGCSYFRHCKLKHIPANKGIDLQPWMQSLKRRDNRYRDKRQNRQRFDTL